jgi:hypothetical protein
MVAAKPPGEVQGRQSTLGRQNEEAQLIRYRGRVLPTLPLIDTDLGPFCITPALEM